MAKSLVLAGRVKTAKRRSAAKGSLAAPKRSRTIGSRSAEGSCRIADPARFVGTNNVTAFASTTVVTTSISDDAARALSAYDTVTSGHTCTKRRSGRSIAVSGPLRIPQPVSRQMNRSARNGLNVF